MFKTENIVSQVLENCAISDSRQAGLYSVCGFVLRMRDLYKWEKGFAPWTEEEPSELLEWIGYKEEIWKDLEEKDFRKISIFGRDYDPFNVDGINAALEPHGLFYGAGFARSLQPSFLLARFEEKRRIDGCRVYILGRELARDLLTVPAFSRDNCILIRKEAAEFFIWDHIFFVNKSGQTALKFALEDYGLKAQDPYALREHLARISAAEMETYLYHELGEIKENVFDRDIWRNIVGTFPHTPIELLARSVKDLLADTNEYGRLSYITRERKTASLGLCVAFFDGLKRELFPELTEAFREFMQTRNWHIIKEATSIGYRKAEQYAQELCSLYLSGKEKGDMDWVEKEIENRLLRPLGLGVNRREGEEVKTK
jgi:hypothetical protein